MMRKSPVMRWKISKATARCNRGEVDRVYCNASRGLSSGPLRVVAIRAIDIFIRGCYL